MPLSEETGEGSNFLSPVFLFSPQKDRCCKLKSSYQHLKHFLSVVSYRSEHQWSSGLRLGEANSEKAKTNREDNDTSVQSQSERDKTVAGNEGGRGRTS